MANDHSKRNNDDTTQHDDRDLNHAWESGRTGPPYQADVATGPAGTPNDRGISGGGLIGNAAEYESTVNSPIKQADNHTNENEATQARDTREDVQEKLSDDAGKINPA